MSKKLSKTMMQKVERWQELQAKLKLIKEQEMKLRLEIADHVSPNTTGTVNVVIGSVSFKIKRAIRRTVSEPVYRSIEQELSNEEIDAIKWSPSVIAANFKKLPEDCLLMEAITEKAGSPELTVVISEIN